MTAMYRLGRRPGLDGVRALAIAVVFLSHVEWTMPGGFYGVDVFFVLSGFLITTILFGEFRRSGRIDLRRFYVRRARRLVPALVCVLVLVAVLFTALFEGSLWKSEIAVGLYVGNWFQAFGGRLAGGMLVQTWSLGIEEQFYFLWPLVLILGLARRWSARSLLLIALVPAVLSFTLRTLLWQPGGPGAGANAFPYFASVTRADSILLGCALAIAIADEGLRARLAFLTRPALAGLALAAIVVAAAFDGGGQPVVWALVVVAAAVLVGHIALTDASAITRLLSTKPLVWLGARSYGVYLYHYPIIVAALAVFPSLDTLPGPVRATLFTAATLLVAAASYRFVEMPLQRAGTGKPQRAAAPSPLAGRPPLLHREPHPAFAQPPVR
jgi:peptidoglycan/LPS O-acetylase OafA/YrhL